MTKSPEFEKITADTIKSIKVNVFSGLKTGDFCSQRRTFPPDTEDV
jgi:hypothetical protein